MNRCSSKTGCGVSKEKWHDIVVKGDWVVSEKNFLCRDLVVEGDFVLIGDIFCRDINIQGNCTIYGSIYSCRNVNVQGNLCTYMISEDDPMSGGCFFPTGDVEIGENLVCDLRIRAGRQKIKVGADLLTRDVECGKLCVAGDCVLWPGTIMTLEAVYVLGNVTTGYPVCSSKVFCGGKYMRKIHWMDDLEENVEIHENCENW